MRHTRTDMQFINAIIIIIAFALSSESAPNSKCTLQRARNGGLTPIDCPSQLTNLSRLRLVVDAESQPVAKEQLHEDVTALIKTGDSLKTVEFIGPATVLSALQAPLLSLLPNLTRLGAACNDKLNSTELQADLMISLRNDLETSRLESVELQSCVWRNRAGVLLARFPSLLSVKYAGGRLNKLAGGDLDNLPNLRYLIFYNCDLESLYADAFDHLQSLLHLTVRENPRLKFLPKGIFNGLNNLERLYLGRNGLQNVATAFQGDLHRLEMLDLSDNRLEWLPDDAFNRLVGLRTLLLNGNPMLQLNDRPFSALCSLISLRTLQIDAQLRKLDSFITGNKSELMCQQLSLNSTASVRLLLVGGGRPKQVSCSPGSGTESCRLVKKLSQPLVAGGKQTPEEPLQLQPQNGSQPGHPSLALLLIFGAICVAHLTVTGALAFVCWRAVVGKHQRQRSRPRQNQRQQRQRDGHLAINVAASVRESDDGDMADDAGRGLMAASSSESAAAAVLVSFRARPNDRQALGSEYEMPDDFQPREKICYEFNEDA